MLRRIWKDFDGSIEYSLNIHEMAHFGAWIFVEYSGIFRELNIRPGNIQFATVGTAKIRLILGQLTDEVAVHRRWSQFKKNCQILLTKSPTLAWKQYVHERVQWFLGKIFDLCPIFTDKNRAKPTNYGNLRFFHKSVFWPSLSWLCRRPSVDPDRPRDTMYVLRFQGRGLRKRAGGTGNVRAGESLACAIPGPHEDD